MRIRWGYFLYLAFFCNTLPHLCDFACKFGVLFILSSCCILSCITVAFIWRKMSALYLVFIPLNFISGWCSLPPVISLECACICAQTRSMHAGHRNPGGSAIQGRKCVAMMAVAFSYGVNATISLIASMAATSGAVVRALSPTSFFSFLHILIHSNDDKRFLSPYTYNNDDKCFFLYRSLSLIW